MSRLHRVADRAVTFVIPGRNRSGGVRVTVDMANGLLDRGYTVRIAYPAARESRVAGLVRTLRDPASALRTLGQRDWLETFQGSCESYRSLGELDFAPGEAVVAVGSLTVLEVAALEADVTKLRYCHGFTRGRPDLMGAPWTVPMSTIAVSPGLVAEIEERTGAPVLGIVPNAVCASDYYPEPGIRREGIGAVFYEHDAKAPEEMLRVLGRIRERWPDVPQHVFGMSRRPPEIPLESYTRAPSIEQARALYSACRVWLVTSRYEGFGLPLLEAMACGTPVVTTRHDGCEGLVECGENGFVVPFGEWDRFIDHVGRVIEDDALHAAAAAKALETAKGFSWDRSVDLMERCLRSVWERDIEGTHVA